MRDLWEGYHGNSSIQTTQARPLLKEVSELDRMPDRIVDLGCGDGTVTELLGKIAPEAHIVGVDASSSQIAAARALDGGITWIENDIMKFLETARDYDLVFSNAALHWIADQRLLYEQIRRALVSGGHVLACQGAAGTYAPLHEIACELAGKREFPALYLSVDEMEEVLSGAGFADFSVICTDARMPYDPDVVRCFAAASLPFYRTDSMSDDEWDGLVQEFLAACEWCRPDIEPRRLYVSARK